MNGGDWLDQALVRAFGCEPNHAANAAPEQVAMRALLSGLLAPTAREPDGAWLTLPADSRYELLDEAGRGGLGIVYRGRDRDLGREVALKVLDRRLADDASFVRRFVEEAQVCGRLQHPGVVPVHEVGLDLAQRPFFVMKLIAGHTFADVLRERSSVADQRRRCLDVFERVCQTMAYAHGQRVIHRDLKPANVMIGAFGEVQVVDWGLAKVLGGSAGIAPASRSAAGGSSPNGHQSQAGTVIGTPCYMPPEQARGEIERLDTRSDVFALGAMLCEILIGTPPYPATDGEPLELARTADLARVHDRLARCGAERELIDLATQCLQAEPRQRPESASAVARAIGAHFAAAEDRARTAQVQAATAKAKARATLLVAGTVLFAVLVGAGSFLWLKQREHENLIADTARVEAALTEAVAAATTARAGDGANVGAWDRAVDAAAQAEKLAIALDVHGLFGDRTARLLAEAEGARQQAIRLVERRERDEAMHERLLEVRIPTAEIMGTVQDRMRVIAAYAELFRDYLHGRDLLTMPIDAAVDALRGDLAVELAGALSYWGSALCGTKPSEAALRDANVLSAIARGLDEDPDRTALRAMKFDSVEAAAKFAGTADVGRWPPAAIQVLAFSLIGCGANEAALSLALRACELHPGDLALTLHCGSLLRYQGRHAEALDYFRTARAMKPTLVAAHHGLGASWAGLRKWSDAEACFRRALDLRRSAPSLVNLGNMLIKQGQHEQGRACCREALSIDSESRHTAAGAYTFLAASHNNERQFKEGLAAARKAHELDPASRDAACFLGVAEFWTGDRQGGLLRIRQLVAESPDNVEYSMHLATMLNTSGRAAEAAALAERFLAQTEEAGVVRVLAEARCLLGDLVEAERCARRAVELSSDRDTNVALAEVLGKRRSRAQELAEVARRIISLAPKSGIGEMYLGMAMRGLKDPARAVEHGQRAIELDPDLAHAHHQLGLTLSQLGQHEAAYECLLRAAKLEPWSTGNLCLAAHVLIRLKRYDEAMRVVDQAMALDDCCARAWMLRGTIHFELGDDEQGLADVDIAVELDPRDALIHHLRAQGQAVSGQVEAAGVSMRTALALDADLLPETLTRALDYRQQGLVPQAVAFLKEVRDAAKAANTPWAKEVLDQASKALAELEQRR